MNRFTVPCFLLLATHILPATAQKVRFTDTSNRWTFVNCHYSEAGDFSYTAAETIRWGRDTVISGKHYVQPGVGSTAPLLYREDTATGKLFFRSIQGGTDTTEQLYFDYNLTVGDTIRKRLPFGVTSKMHVASLDSVLLGGVSHRLWTLVLDSSSLSVASYRFLEGVGCVDGFQVPLVGMWWGGQLRCFTNRNAQPACTPISVGGCGSPTSGVIRSGYQTVSEFDNTSSCTFIPIAVQDPEPAGTPVLAPNPGGAAMQLRLPATFGHGVLRVHTLTGQIVHEMRLNGAQPYAIGQALQVPGVYRYVVEDAASGVRYSGRLIAL